MGSSSPFYARQIHLYEEKEERFYSVFQGIPLVRMRKNAPDIIWSSLTSQAPKNDPLNGDKGYWWMMKFQGVTGRAFEVTMQFNGNSRKNWTQKKVLPQTWQRKFFLSVYLENEVILSKITPTLTGDVDGTHYGTFLWDRFSKCPWTHFVARRSAGQRSKIVCIFYGCSKGPPNAHISCSETYLMRGKGREMQWPNSLKEDSHSCKCELSSK